MMLQVLHSQSPWGFLSQIASAWIQIQDIYFLNQTFYRLSYLAHFLNLHKLLLKYLAKCLSTAEAHIDFCRMTSQSLHWSNGDVDAANRTLICVRLDSHGVTADASKCAFAWPYGPSGEINADGQLDSACQRYLRCLQMWERRVVSSVPASLWGFSDGTLIRKLAQSLSTAIRNKSLKKKRFLLNKFYLFICLNVHFLCSQVVYGRRERYSKLGRNN